LEEAPVETSTATRACDSVCSRLRVRPTGKRQKNGTFKKFEDLMNVSGVGEKSFLKMKPLITVAAVKASAQDE